jgi:uncharacterized RDD family membrane protein YckC
MNKRVGFGPRLGAVLIDCVAIAILGTLFGGILGSAFGLGAGAVTGAATDERGAAAAAAAVGFFGLIEAFTGASPGKMVLKLKIGYEDGRNAPVATYVTRWAVKYSGSILTALGLITGISFLGTLGTLAGLVVFVGCFLVLADKKQALHDMAAKTAVFNKADLI